MVIIDTLNSINIPCLVKSNTKGTVGLVGSRNTNGTFNMTIIKPGINSSAFVGQYINGTDLSGYTIVRNGKLIIGGN